MILLVNSRYTTRTRKHKSFTKDICFCGECGSHMTLEKHTTISGNIVNLLLEKENPTESDKSIFEETRREIDIEEIHLISELEKSQHRMANMMKLVDLALSLATNAYTAFQKTEDDELSRTSHEDAF